MRPPRCGRHTRRAVRAVQPRCRGRLVGWSAEEFTALGVPFARRGRRTEEYVAAMRTLWAEDPASFAGEFTRFDAIRVNPKPVRGGRLPVVFGGNSDTALRRAVTLVAAGQAAAVSAVEDGAGGEGSRHCEPTDRPPTTIPAPDAPHPCCARTQG
ncbi:LLM class flavin-dependent oxidoreductase [Streptomyces sp. NPDC097610]|uniref:LLM class flavin-dependent oxidoreductase n=1 Tax=Streptomyces sp. NPDC097610 TaxID=3157227 RepID=UPI00331E2087